MVQKHLKMDFIEVIYQIVENPHSKNAPRSYSAEESITEDFQHTVTLWVIFANKKGKPKFALDSTVVHKPLYSHWSYEVVEGN